MDISLCMIVKNEEAVLARCLESVKGIADEVVIVDTGSSDRTKEIAARYTEKIYDFPWIDDFAAARNEAFSKATKEYQLWLDADDVIDEENRQRLMELKQTLPSEVDMVMMRYQMGTNDQFVYYRERLFKRSKGFVWVNPVHEVIVPDGKVIYSEITITHRKEKISDPNRNLRIYEQQIKQGVMFDARETFYYARELYAHQEYEKAIEQFQIFLNHKEAWVENKIEACLGLYACYQAVGKQDEALNCLFRSFCFDVPRAEVMVAIGDFFLNCQEFMKAIYWYQCALQCKPNMESGAFIRMDCYGYIPCLQLCVCYDRLHDIKKAKLYNDQAWQIHPDSIVCAQNEAYFKSLEIETEEQK